jgi:hypothetical protein
MSIHSSWRGLLERSSGFPGTEVDGARGGSWGRHCFTQLYLAAKPPHMGVDVDGDSLLSTPSYRLWVSAYGAWPLDQCRPSLLGHQASPVGAAARADPHIAFIR